MTPDRINEEYRSYTLLAAYHQGKFKGRTWKDKALVHEIEGEGLEEILQRLRAEADRRINEQVAARTETPSVEEYTASLRKILGTLSDRRLLMLKAHYEAPDRAVTAAQLSKLAGYASHGAANLQYGLVGRALFEELPCPLATRADGSAIYTSAIATTPDTSAGPEEQWVWTMRPEVASAMVALGLHK
ncbi:MAG: hypothetical protein JWP52_572 [Rhizobacter sp.]|nr:hypothetical protein [Rhizobacter sp.]